MSNQNEIIIDNRHQAPPVLDEAELMKCAEVASDPDADATRREEMWFEGSQALVELFIYDRRIVSWVIEGPITYADAQKRVAKVNAIAGRLHQAQAEAAQKH